LNTDKLLLQSRRLLGETKLLTPAEIALVVRKTAETAFYRNSKQFLGEELALSPLRVTVGDFIEQRHIFTPSVIREEDKIVEIRKHCFLCTPNRIA
jgi:SpoVK/Ycf46/Vps4 family AAA+-type ATPase